MSKSFGELLQSYRKRAKDPHTHRMLTQERVAELLETDESLSGYTHVRVSNWERGEEIIKHDNRDLLVALIRILVKGEGIVNVDEANNLLHEGNYRNLNNDEIFSINPRWSSQAMQPKSARQAENSLRVNLPKVTYYIEHDNNRIEQRLKPFRSTISLESIDEEGVDDNPLPSAAIVGIGRCGTNISNILAGLVINSIEKKETENDEAAASELENPDSKRWFDNPTSLLNRFRALQPKKHWESGMSTVAPVVMIGDLDERTFVGIRASQTFHQYKKLILLDQIQAIQGGGAGHIPVIGQYIGRVALNINPQNSNNELNKSWSAQRNYLIDSPGMDLNATRLYFFLFSTGGGSGSGMALEFGLAQQYAFLQKISKFDQNSSTNKRAKFQPICSIGIGILPTIERERTNSAVFLNSGRILCRYLAQEQRFNSTFDYDQLDPYNLRPFNGLLLVSNDVMKSIPEENVRKKDDSAKEGVSDAERQTNTYVALQIMNLLTAQALGSENIANDLAISLDSGGDTIQLDASDLYNSLNGPMVVAYAETSQGQLDPKDLLLRSISPPTRDMDTKLLEGISMLPTYEKKYTNLLNQAQANFQELSELQLFKRANSLVTVIAIPKNFDLLEKDFRILQDMLVELFPNARIRRFSLIKTDSDIEQISLTIFISGSACTCPEVVSHFFAYLKSCFLNNDDEADSLIQDILRTIRAKQFNAKEYLERLNDVEDLTPILAGYGGKGNWESIKGINEANFKSFLPRDEFQSIDDMKIRKLDILDALEYIHKSLMHGEIEDKLPLVDLND